MTELTDLTLSQALSKLRAQEFSSVELTNAYLNRIANLDGKIGAYITVTREVALRAAEAADTARRQGDERPLLGIPMAMKDVLSTEGVETTCGSKILRGYCPVFN